MSGISENEPRDNIAAHQTRRAPGRAKTMRVAGGLTFVMLASATLLGWYAHQPSGCTSGTYSCLTAADWGDFIAGVFAPIAFIWLVAAVWIQSQELAEQREELRLTRLEFGENRKVMREQAEEARKQAEFIGLQTKILERQEDERLTAQKRDNFSDLILELNGLVDQHFVHRAIITGQPAFAGGSGYSTFGAGKGGADKVLIEFGKHLASDPHNYGLKGPYAFHPSIIEKTKAAGLLAGQIIAISDQLGEAQKSTIARLELKDLKANIDALLQGQWPLPRE
ncbi:hypothetical protein [Rhizobium mongolense]